MMRILLISVSFIATLCLSAQNFEYVPEFSTISEELDLTDDFSSSKIHAELANNSQALSSLIWKIEQIEGPDAWEVQLCVNNESGACFGWGVTTNGMEGFPVLAIKVGQSSIMDLGLRPHGEAGCGRYTISVAHSTAPDDIIEVGTYEFKINTDASCLTSTGDLEEAKIKLYPNPTDLSFKLENSEDLQQIRIINAVGKEVLTTAYTAERSYDISNLNSGLYFVQAQDKNGQVLKTLRLIKK